MVRRILAAAGVGMQQLIGNTAVLRSLAPRQFTDERFGLPTVHDVPERSGASGGRPAQRGSGQNRGALADALRRAGLARGSGPTR